MQIDQPMRFGLLFLIFTTAIFNSYAQERCGSQAPTTGEFENWISTKIAERQARIEQPLAPLYQIPVVVHVFHKGEPMGTGVNLSEERIKAQIDSLTADFRRMNADAKNTPPEFLPVAADVEIEFVLAKQDPAGNPTNGIVRMRGSKDSYRSNSDRPLLRSESYWPAEHYLNIFVTDLQVFLGYASFPLISLEGIVNGSEDYIFDGILIDYEYFGVNPSAPSFESYGRTLTHEVGHYLGLRHIWGDGNCSVDDFVDDTPLADTDNGEYSSPCTFPNPDDNTVCVSGEPEMFQNYMDYTDDICMNLFTEGQKTRMRTVMDNATNRTSLISSPGLSEPIRFADDLAAVDILSPNLAECETTLTPELRVVNYGTTEITSYDVQLLIDSSPMGSPQSIATSLQPLDSDTISFSTQTINANSTISFEISNVNGGTDGNTSNNSISQLLTSTSSTTLPFIQDMESAPGFLGGIGTDLPWEVTTAPKESPSNNALIFKAYNNTEWFGEETMLKTPVFDLTNITSGEIQFSYAHANRPDAFYDGFMIKASVDCGNTFPDILFSAFGPDLATTSETDAYFTPSNSFDWIDTLISITTGYRGIDGVQFAFVGINGSGNNIYLDNVQIVETNLLENDVKPLSLSAPLIICSETSEVNLTARNNGSEPVTSFEIKYFVNGDTSTASFNGLNIPSKDKSTFSFLASNLNVGENEVGIKITTVNNVSDESIDENIIKTTLNRDNIDDEYPLTVDFEVQDNWQLATSGQSNIWERVEVASNGTLRANGFDATELGEKNWFISPRLNTGGLDSAGLYFRASYASRDGFDDQLQVLLSTDCGQNYYQTHLLDADSDSLAVTTSSEKWVPTDASDWKEYQIDLSQTFFFDEDIRIAFVFTPGGGNDLYIDDISIRGNEPPTYEDFVRTYPNPAVSQFNIGLNLPQKESVVIRLQDISGRIVFEERLENALNQILEYKAPSQEGLYFLTVTGRGFSSSQKLFISR